MGTSQPDLSWWRGPFSSSDDRKMRSQKQKPPTRRISSNYDFLGLSGQHITPKTAGRDYVCPKDLEVLFQEADYEGAVDGEACADPFTIELQMYLEMKGFPHKVFKLP
ncbi:hypothetical protein ACHWQZ_G002961 [Mnemiopsis leidyi]